MSSPRDPVTDLPTIHRQIAEVLAGTDEPYTVADWMRPAEEVLDAVVRPLLEENERLRDEVDRLSEAKVVAFALPDFLDDPVAHRLGFHDDCERDHDGAAAEYRQAIDALLAEVDALRARVGYRQVGWRWRWLAFDGTWSPWTLTDKGPSPEESRNQKREFVPVYVKEEQE